jgi:hypothetical protein
MNNILEQLYSTEQKMASMTLNRNQLDIAVGIVNDV